MPSYQIKWSKTGQWHRRDRSNGNGDHTACGLPIPPAYLSREWQLDEDLCLECFTPRERDTGKMKRIEKDALERAAANDLVDEWDGRDHETTDEIDPVPMPPPLPDPEDPDDPKGGR